MKKEEQNDNRRMMRSMRAIYLILTFGVGIAIIGGIINIQWKHGKEWRRMGDKRVDDVRSLPARRGNIYSSDGKILATTVTECDLYLDLYNAPELDRNGNVRYDGKGRRKELGPIADSNFDRHLDTVCEMLATSMRRHTAEYYRDMLLAERRRNGKLVPSKRNPSDSVVGFARRCFRVEKEVPYSVWLELQRVPGWKQGVVRQVDGESVIRQSRAHIYGNMARNTIGFPNQRGSNQTFTGLEGAYDSLLSGQDGKMRCRRLTKGIWLPDEPRTRMAVPQRTDIDKIDTIVLQPKIDGRSIVSTIDTRYQDIAEHSLRSTLNRYGGVAGCAILMEMQTGYVLACANLAIDTSVHEYREVRDRNVAVSDVIEPGSTFKTVALLAMLSDPETKIDTASEYAAWHKDFGGKGGQVQDDHAVRDSLGRIRSTLNVREIIQHSSNVGMADMGMALYGDRRSRLRQRMLDIFPYDYLNPDVRAPQSRAYIHEDMAPISNFTRLCFGYSTRVSPLQIATFYNALGAGGRMVKPLFCKGVMEGDKIVLQRPVVINPRICSREQALLMRHLLEEVVERGTGNNIKNTTYGIAGKTGTAYHSYANTRRYNASFAGFFPSENPRYTCYVLLEDVPSFGRQAAEVFKAISDCVVAMDKSLSDGAVKSVWPRLEEDSSKAVQRPIVERGDQSRMRGLYKMIRQPFLSADSSAHWVVYHSATDSTPAQYYPYQPSGGLVPNCIGMTARDAVEMLQSQGYRCRMQGYGKVSSQQPSPGSKIRKGGTVILTLKH